MDIDKRNLSIIERLEELRDLMKIGMDKITLQDAMDEIERLRASMADLKYRETYFERAYMAARRTLDSKGIHMDYFLSRADYEAELKEGEKDGKKF